MISTDNTIPEPPQHELPRELGLVTATAVVVASMIGTGIFTTTGLILAELPGNCDVVLGSGGPVCAERCSLLC